MDNERGPEMKLGLGVTLQLVAVLIAIGIAWGSLSAKQSAMDQVQREQRDILNGVVTQKLDDIQNRLTRLELSVRRERAQR